MAFLVICCCPGYPRREHFLNWNQRSHLVPSARRARILVCRGGCLPLDGKVLVSKLTYRALNVILDVLITYVACFE